MALFSPVDDAVNVILLRQSNSRTLSVSANPSSCVDTQTPGGYNHGIIYPSSPSTGLKYGSFRQAVARFSAGSPLLKALFIFCSTRYL